MFSIMRGLMGRMAQWFPGPFDAGRVYALVLGFEEGVLHPSSPARSTEEGAEAATPQRQRTGTVHREPFPDRSLRLNQGWETTEKLAEIVPSLSS